MCGCARVLLHHPHLCSLGGAHAKLAGSQVHPHTLTCITTSDQITRSTRRLHSLRGLDSHLRPSRPSDAAREGRGRRGDAIECCRDAWGDMIARGRSAFLILPTFAGGNEGGEAVLMFSPVRNERGDARGGTYLQEEDFSTAIHCARPRLRTGLNLHGTCHFTHSANLVMGPGGEGEARGTGQTSHQLWGSYIRLSRAAVSSRRRASPRERLAATRATLPRSFAVAQHGRVKLPGNGVHFGAYGGV